jgi:hypothetical protein
MKKNPRKQGGMDGDSSLEGVEKSICWEQAKREITAEPNQDMKESVPESAPESES